MRSISRFTAALFSCLWLMVSGTASADLITLNFNSPVEIIAGGTTPVQFFVTNNTDTDAPADFFAGYQIAFELRANAGATGAITLLPPEKPDDYVFASNSGIDAQTVVGPNPSLRVIDTAFPFTAGVQVPISGINLFRLPVMASSDASGSFSIVAVNNPGLMRTEWTDSNSPTQLAHDFNNLATGEELFVGSIVIVPEPSSFLALGMIAAMVLASKYLPTNKRSLVCGEWLRL